VQLAADEDAGYQSLIIGYADGVSIDANRRVARIDGRDLSSLLIDSRLNQAFPQHSADAIVSLLALQHGLSPRVQPTPGIVGRLFSGDQGELGLSVYAGAVTDWDLIVRLARQYDYDVFVRGHEFYFQPGNGVQGGQLEVSPNSVIELRLDRSYCLEERRGISIVSWNSEVARTTDSLLGRSAGLLGTVQGSGYIGEPNLRPDLLAASVSRSIAEAQRLSRRVEVVMPGDTVTMPRAKLVVRGTSTQFDQTYCIECVDRSFSPSSGFIQRVKARQSGD
jgi:hypothetical protein